MRWPTLLRKGSPKRNKGKTDPRFLVQSHQADISSVGGFDFFGVFPNLWIIIDDHIVAYSEFYMVH